MSLGKKGTGFKGAARAHEHWHIDIAYLNLAGTFYYVCGVFDGFSRSIVHWEIRDSMKESEVEIILQRALERYPGVSPRIISDNGPQFIAKDFKEFIRQTGMTHVLISPYYPQSNGKMERFNKTLKTEAVRAAMPQTLYDARRIVERFVNHYNGVRLHSAIDYIVLHDMLEGRHDDIIAERGRRLEEARDRRRRQRHGLPPITPLTEHETARAA